MTAWQFLTGFLTRLARSLTRAAARLLTAPAAPPTPPVATAGLSATPPPAAAPSPAAPPPPARPPAAPRRAAPPSRAQGTAHALRVDGASVVFISSPPASTGSQPPGSGTCLKGNGGATPPASPVTVLVLPPSPRADTGKEQACADHLLSASPAPPGTAGAARPSVAASPAPSPWPRPAGLPHAPSDGLRGSWERGREPWFTGRWAR